MTTRILTPVGNVADLLLWKPKMVMLQQAGYECIVKMGCLIDDNRNYLVTNNCQKIKQKIPDGVSIFIDSDMDFDLEDVQALEDACHKYPIIGVPYRNQKDDGIDCCGNKEHSKSGIVEVPYTGTGMLAIQNFVFSHMDFPYFSRPIVKKSGFAAHMGEDLYFCQEARKLGFKIHAHYGITIKHNIRKEQLMDNQKKSETAPQDLDKPLLAVQEILSAMNKAYKAVYAQACADQAELAKAKPKVASKKT